MLWRSSMAIKKRKKTHFKVLNFGAKNRKRVKARWRKPRGIDNKQGVKRVAYGARPKVGYGNSVSVRFRRLSGKLEKLVHNSNELLAISDTNNYVAVLSHALSTRKKAELQRLADSKGIEVANRVTP